MNLNRVRQLNKAQFKGGPVVYWMSRDQRASDNWALLYAQELAFEKKSPLVVVFCLVNDFLNASLRHYEFMLNGLIEVEAELKKKNIPFVVVSGNPIDEIPKFINTISAGAMITDFDPLKIKRKWKDGVKNEIAIPFYEVDAHNIVPCWVASDKQEFGAYTIRPKINKILNLYFEEFTSLKSHQFKLKKRLPVNDWNLLKTKVRNKGIYPLINYFKSGAKAGRNVLKKFLDERLEIYYKYKNDPTIDCQSNLSPYLHFGQLSAQQIAIEVSNRHITRKAKNSFLEELIIRKELADNYCFYNESYDDFEGFPSWAKETLGIHSKDKRQYIYTIESLERGKTHDYLWNAAQMEMVIKGKMHGYMRMYWCKKILEWTNSAKEALKFAIYLNDKYEIDGRDSNGYTGIAWSIGGVHDRPWPERKIFGKIRFMSYNGCMNKFDIDVYIKTIKDLQKEVVQ